jgi:hypothetical protein
MLWIHCGGGKPSELQTVGSFPVSAAHEIFVSRSAYKFQEEARFIPPWITLWKVCPAVAKEAALLTEEQTRIDEENIK